MKKSDSHGLFNYLRERSQKEKVSKRINIFISYNNKDQKIAEEIALKLSLEGWNIIFDIWKVKPGDSIVKFMETGLKKAQHFILIWSKNSSKSKWVLTEWRSIISKILDNKIKFIPLKIDDTPMPQLLSDFKYVTITNDITDYYKLFYAITGKNPESKFVHKVMSLMTEITMDAFAVKQIEVTDDELALQKIGSYDFWNWELVLKKGKNHSHNFKKVEWDEKLGSNYGNQTKFFFIFKQLMVCECGEKRIFNQICERINS